MIPMLGNPNTAPVRQWASPHASVPRRWDSHQLASLAIGIFGKLVKKCWDPIGMKYPDSVPEACNSSAKPPTPLPPAGAPACRLLRQCVPPAVCCAVPLPIAYAHRCSGPPHRAHRFRLDLGCAVALTKGSVLGMRVQVRALFVSGALI
jgi:hypothetical protein